MYVDIGTYLDELRTVSPDSPDIADIHIASLNHKDLKLFRHPNGRMVLCSYDAGVYADTLEFGTDGARHWVSRSLDDAGVRIYDDPPVIYLGRDNPNGFGVCRDADLADRLSIFGWDRDTTKKVWAYLDQRPRIDW